MGRGSVCGRPVLSPPTPLGQQPSLQSHLESLHASLITAHPFPSPSVQPGGKGQVRLGPSLFLLSPQNQLSPHVAAAFAAHCFLFLAFLMTLFP